MSIKSCFKRSFKKQHGKCAQTLFKYEWQDLYYIYISFWRQLTFKKFLFVIFKISRLFPNTLCAHAKYSFLNRDNLTQPIQMILSRKQKTFWQFFCAFLKSSLNFEHFQKKMTLIAEVFPKLQSLKNKVRAMSIKTRFKGSFKKQHGKCAQTLFEFAWHKLNHIYSSLWRQLTLKKFPLVIY